MLREFQWAGWAITLLNQINRKDFYKETFNSTTAIKDAISGETYSGAIDVSVTHYNMLYIYKNIYVKIYYNTAYAQMNLDIIWEDDESQPEYKTIGLHGTYNTNFQEFTYSDGVLNWKDNNNVIAIRFD